MPRSWSRALHPGRAAELLRAAAAFSAPGALLRAYLGVAPPAYPLAVRTRGGTRFTVRDRHDAATAWMVFCRREYPVPAGARCIVDLGANFGAFTLFAAARAPGARIVAVEPHPEAFPRLCAHVAENALGDRVECLPLAVAGAAGERWMSADPRDPGPSRGIHPPGTAPNRPFAGVRAVPFGELLEAALAAAGASTVDLLKVDVEGAEHEIVPHLTPALLAPVRRWAMEYHPNGPRKPLFAALEAAGLRLVRHRADGPGSGIAWFSR
jgi:FkbM family methyltransferase